MNEPTLAGVMQRLERLERQHRWWKGWGLAAVVVLGLVVLLGATRAKDAGVVEEIRARRFTLVDRKGFSRGQFFVNDEYDATVLEMNEPKDASSIMIAVSAFGSFLSLSNTNGNAGVMLGVRCILGVPTSCTPAYPVTPLIQLRLDNGKPRLELGEFTAGIARVRAALGHTELTVKQTGVVEQRPASSLVLLNEGGKLLWSVPQTPNPQATQAPRAKRARGATDPIRARARASAPWRAGFKDL